MKIALISDKLTMDSLFAENDIGIINVTKYNYKNIFKDWKPDILFAESTWLGYNDEWRYKVAAYPDYPRCKNKQLNKIIRYINKLGFLERNNSQLKTVVGYAKDLKIPTVFWNKEDGVHFDRFIDSARLFDYIFTVDENCIDRYKAIVGNSIPVNTLMFAIQPKFHYFMDFNIKNNRANFVGSYSTHIHDNRRRWQDMMFKLTSQIFGLDVYDRNSERKSNIYRYPNIDNVNIFPSVSYKETADIYRDYLVSLNVNTIENSPTMFSRRLIEILACGRIAITNDTPAIQKYFKDYCYSFKDEYELQDLLYKINKFGLDKHTQDKLKSAAEYIANNFTWKHRLEYIKEIIGII